MRIGQSVTAATCALVHTSARTSDAQQARHEAFIVSKLALSFVALSIAPIFLALRGAPTPLETLVFALSLVPLAAAMVVARTGRVSIGHALVFLGVIVFSLTLVIGLHTGPGGAFVWLLVAQLEVVVSRDRRLVRLGALVVSAIVGGIVAATLQWNLTATAAPYVTVAIGGLGVLYCAGLSLLIGCAARTSRARDIRRRPCDGGSEETFGRRQRPTASRTSAAAASALRDEAIATMSHELRTPLNAIIGFSERLTSASLRPANVAHQHEYAAIIYRAGQHLLSVVDALIDVTKARSGRITLDPKRFAPGLAIDRCCEMVRLLAERGGVSIQRDTSAMPTAIVCDEQAFTQVVLNILTNAVKFTAPGGRVKIAARQDGDALLISLRDTGIGIQRDDLARIGEPFFKGQSRIATSADGLGVGLSIVRNLVGLHGGTIEIASEVGAGTRVGIRLPLDCRDTFQTEAATIEIVPLRSHDRPLEQLDARMKLSA